jgi:uncharacterized protein (UPF0332 family)
MKVVVDEPLKDIISYFDQVRKKRHRTIYDEAGLVTEKEAREVLQKARKFLSYIEKVVRK